jgi:hypothetical protein
LYNINHVLYLNGLRLVFIMEQNKIFSKYILQEWFIVKQNAQHPLPALQTALKAEETRRPDSLI